MTHLKSQISHLKSKKAYAIIVAGGSSSRMRAALPKQFLLLNGKPVLMYTISNFEQSDFKPEIILVLSADFHEYWKQLCIDHQFHIPHVLVTGGATRFHSVKNGLDLIPDDEDTLIAVQDAVRPLTSVEVIDKAYLKAAKDGNAVVAVKSRDSVRRVLNNRSECLVRDEIYLVQTPQTFQSTQLKKAYEQTYNAKFTDDASVVEETGAAINLVEGDHRNMKITFPEDIAIAQLLLKQSV